MIACDSSSAIAFLQGETAADTDAFATALRRRELHLPPMVLTELLSSPALTADASAFLADLPLVELSSGFWRRAGEARRLVATKGLKAKLADTLIAQCCIDADIALITRDGDFRHFADHCGLKLAV